MRLNSIIFTQVNDIPNPFDHGLARFRFAFNKLLLWNLTQYERIVYFDADNVVVHVDKAEELFLCGHFCVVYMNPCHFHTGLLVIRPDTALLGTMLDKLASTGSYDGADQGFLSAFFEACDEAPMFTPSRGVSNRPLNQLHTSYNMHSLYSLATGSFEHFRCGPFMQTPSEPVASLGFPVPTIIKPWFWWVGILGHAGAWQQVRNELREPDLPWVPITLLVFLSVALLVAHRAVSHVVEREFPTYTLHQYIVRMGPKGLALLLFAPCLIGSVKVGALVTPRLIRPVYGIVLFGVAHFSVMTLLARLGAFFLAHVRWHPSYRTWLPAIACYLAFFQGRLLDHVMAAVLGWGFHTAVLRAAVIIPTLLVQHLTVFFHITQHSPLFTK